MIQTWRLDSPDQTLVFATQDQCLPRVLYWGKSLPLTEDLVALVISGEMDVTGGMLDANPDISLCPAQDQNFPGHLGMEIFGADGAPVTPRLRLQEVDVSADQLVFHCADTNAGIRYSAHFCIDATTGIITTKARLHCQSPMRLNWLAAPVLPAPQNSIEMVDFAGRWCGEFQTNTIPWSSGMRYRENRTGRTGHEHFPGLYLPCTGAQNTTGSVYALHYGWSGGHAMVAEELPDGRRQVQFGHAKGSHRDARQEFETAPLYAIYSPHGTNGCSIGFQRHLRDQIVKFPNSAAPRPVHYNCWEAVYFDHKIDELKDIATRAHDLGAERFVLDDGWFGLRDDDTSSLGDWDIDPRKYPDGLAPLVDHVTGLGMGFGIWFEPEMINPDSATYRAHPDWILGAPDQILGRQQMVLDLRIGAVQDYLFEKISNILSAYAVEYVKWDHNRVLPVSDAAQTEALYVLLARLNTAFPLVEFESCASGGGRIDFGILHHTHRVWLSDSNDALERLQIQHNAALFLPSIVTGSHVGPRNCHTSGRVIDMGMRAWVAAQRHMGFEMDPRELTDDEADTLRTVTTWWKSNRHWMGDADILRLNSADPAVVAEQQLSADAGRFVVFAGKVATSRQILPRPLPLTRLDPDAIYRIQLVNRADPPTLSRAEQAIKTQPLDLSGAYLMNHGLTLPWTFPTTIWVVEGKRL
ncbi:alpha-galactosidase [Amylibacter marinus]|uniref:alpha-galactosidase n=1 Tax=Amylibacter marinus TaxID=1475483 RepID=A0ABQ5VUA1_9RHOB|nr:alpha-galactosidase [Amylibacter marinus]GLQ34837.1 alpha-galactosidase [Amylibacter marinus]